MKYSIVMLAHNSLALTIGCINSIFKKTKDFELIIVDNNSTDGTVGYLKELDKMYDNVNVTFNPENYSFAKACNQGLELATGEYVIFLSNDIVVSDGWADKMDNHFKKVPLSNIGAIGPVSSMSNGKQFVGKQNPVEWFNDHKGRWVNTGVLYGWCMMIPKRILDEIGGFDERFYNSHEDNDLSLRLQLAGYKLVVAYDTYIDHLGQGTLRNEMDTEKYMENGYINREKYYDKYKVPGKKKLVAVYRTNNGKYLNKSLEQTSKFADSIIIHFCRASITNEGITKLINKFPKIVKVQKYNGIFQEDYERGWLLEEALKLQEEGKADWCISVDDDEIYEDKFIDRVQKLMNPQNPEIFGYWCQWRTIWKKELGVEYYRTDSVFGRFSNYRFFKLMKDQEISSKHPEGHHCGSAPLMAPENLRWCNIRVKHLGYDTPEQRQKKFDFYQTNDNFKTRQDIGNEDYSHLIDMNVMVDKYIENNGISLVMMVKNEEDMIRDCLEHVQHVVDEYVIVDTGSTDKTIDIINKFAEHSSVPVKLLHYPWCDNYSIPRNFGKDNASQRWILHLDADERIKYEDLKMLFEVTEHSFDIGVVSVANYLERTTTPGQKPKIAPTQAIRLFRNIPEFFYTGVIHETIGDSMIAYSLRNKVRKGVVPFILHHYGYLRGKERIKDKMEYYEKLNNHQLELTDGTDPRPYYNLALHYSQVDDNVKCLEYLQKALKINPNFWHASQHLYSMNLDSAKTFARNVLNSAPADHPVRQSIGPMLEYLEKNHVGNVKVY